MGTLAQDITQPQLPDINEILTTQRDDNDGLGNCPTQERGGGDLTIDHTSEESLGGFRDGARHNLTLNKGNDRVNNPGNTLNRGPVPLGNGDPGSNPTDGLTDLEPLDETDDSSEQIDFPQDDVSTFELEEDTNDETSSNSEHIDMRCNKNKCGGVKIASLNMKGGGSSTTREKWLQICQLMREKRIDILAVQETHLSESTKSDLNDLFSRQIRIEGSTDPN